MGLPVGRFWYFVALSIVLGSTAGAPVSESVTKSAASSQIKTLNENVDYGDQEKYILLVNFTNDRINDSEHNEISSPFDEKELAENNLLENGVQEVVQISNLPPTSTKVTLEVAPSAKSASTEKSMKVTTITKVSTTTRPTPTVTLPTLTTNVTSDPILTITTQEALPVSTATPALSTTITPAQAEGSFTANASTTENIETTTEVASISTTISTATEELLRSGDPATSEVHSEHTIIPSCYEPHTTTTGIEISNSDAESPITTTATPTSNGREAPTSTEEITSTFVVENTSDSDISKAVSTTDSPTLPTDSIETTTELTQKQVTAVFCPCATQTSKSNIEEVTNASLSNSLINSTEIPSTTTAESFPPTTTETVQPQEKILVEAKPSSEGRSVSEPNENSSISEAPATPVTVAATTTVNSTEPAEQAVETTTYAEDLPSSTTKLVPSTVSPNKSDSTTIVTIQNAEVDEEVHPASGEQVTTTASPQLINNTSSSIISTESTFQTEHLGTTVSRLGESTEASEHFEDEVDTVTSPTDGEVASIEHTSTPGSTNEVAPTQTNYEDDLKESTEGTPDKEEDPDKSNSGAPEINNNQADTSDITVPSNDNEENSPSTNDHVDSSKDATVAVGSVEDIGLLRQTQKTTTASLNFSPPPVAAILSLANRSK